MTVIPTGRCFLQPLQPPGGILINLEAQLQRIDGFGAADSPLGLDSAKADLFFSPTAGIGLSLLRLPYASNSTGPTPYYPETSTIATFYNDATLAAARGALIWATPWSAMTTSWKDNNSFVAGHLLSAHFADFAAFNAGLQADLVANGGPSLYGMSVVDEPDITGVSYTSMQMSASDMVTYIKNNLGPALAALNPRPLLIAPECVSWDTTATYLSALAADATAYSYIDVIATHQYEGTVAPFATTKRVWQTEMSGIGDTFDASITHGLTVAGWIHSALTTGGVNAWSYWWTRNVNNDNEGLIGNNSDDTLTKRLYVLGQWAKFVRPGFYRATTSSDQPVSGVYVTAFVNPVTSKFVIVAINQNGGTATLPFACFGSNAGSVTPWLTNASNSLAAQSLIGIAGGIFSATLPAASVTSFVSN